MARWMHPCPGFGKIEFVVPLDRQSQCIERQFIVLFAIFQFPFEHGLANVQDISNGIAEKNRIFGNCLEQAVEFNFRGFRVFDIAQGGVSDSLAVVVHGYPDRGLFRGIGQMVLNQLSPFSEAYVYMGSHSGITIQDAGHKRVAGSNQLRCRGRAYSICGGDCRTVLSEKHGSVHV